eukprot:3862286-Alexandrium_andersonii.AAC.1
MEITVHCSVLKCANICDCARVEAACCCVPLASCSIQLCANQHLLSMLALSVPPCRTVNYCAPPRG